MSRWRVCLSEWPILNRWRVSERPLIDFWMGHLPVTGWSCPSEGSLATMTDGRCELWSIAGSFRLTFKWKVVPSRSFLTLITLSELIEIGVRSPFQSHFKFTNSNRLLHLLVHNSFRKAAPHLQMDVIIINLSPSKITFMKIAGNKPTTACNPFILWSFIVCSTGRHACRIYHRHRNVRALP